MMFKPVKKKQATGYYPGGSQRFSFLLLGMRHQFILDYLSAIVEE